MNPAPTRAAVPGAAVLVSLALLFAAGGCDDRPRTGSSDGSTTSPAYPERRDSVGLPTAIEMPVATRPASWTMPFPPTSPKPGYARGRVVGQSGKPVAIPGVRITINFYGISHAAGKRVEKSHDIAGADGSYEVQLEDGMYRPVTAVIEVPFENRHFRFDLHPLQETFGHGQESTQGIAQDFVWKLSGLRPKEPPDPTRPESWYGATIQLRYSGYREDLKLSVPRPPEGTKVIFTLTPLTPLADGTQGRVITFERSYGPLGLDNPMLTDVPLARYSLRGQENFPDTRTGKILILGENGQWGEEAQGTFGSELAAKAVGKVVVRFSRPIE